MNRKTLFTRALLSVSALLLGCRGESRGLPAPYCISSDMVECDAQIESRGEGFRGEALYKAQWFGPLNGWVAVAEPLVPLALAAGLVHRPDRKRVWPSSVVDQACNYPMILSESSARSALPTGDGGFFLPDFLILPTP
jgi:hypothetical protein